MLLVTVLDDVEKLEVPTLSDISEEEFLSFGKRISLGDYRDVVSDLSPDPKPHVQRVDGACAASRLRFVGVRATRVQPKR
jgi:hypothetical protein